jgi:hypothetical protein
MKVYKRPEKGDDYVKIAFLKVFLLQTADSCIQNIMVLTPVR